jgi:hypothetical protein
MGRDENCCDDASLGGTTLGGWRQFVLDATLFVFVCAACVFENSKGEPEIGSGLVGFAFCLLPNGREIKSWSKSTITSGGI